MEKVIVTEGLTKYYGRARGVLGLDLEVERGEVFGFLGPNGAGKTTTLRLLLDLIRPTSGRAYVFGMETTRESVKIRSRTGYLPGELALYDRLTGEEFLRFFARLRGGVDWGYVEELCRRLDADPAPRLSSLSRGNKQKFGLIQAFMHRPELLILDEPTSGLDPLMQQEFHRMVEEAREDGITTFISSHNLPEVERICDRVAFIREGRLVEVVEVASLKERSLHRVEVFFSSPPPPGSFDSVPGVLRAEQDGELARLLVKGNMDSVVKALARFQVQRLV
ncbi:MAG: ABC transporter ATP-binding protein, partial [Candidatus Geothermincolales bacterium]